MQAVAANLSHLEKQAIFSIAVLFALRMLGLFMIVPLFALYAHSLKGATPFLIGVALGCYGLSQALLQMPFGLWSDRFGRKPVILTGLIIFLLGSIIAALSHTVWGMILGRTLQGAGAIGSATQALLADLTRPAQRTKAMAAVGITIGLSFTLAMIIGPLLSGLLAMSGIFWLSSFMALAGIVILLKIVPTPLAIKNDQAKPFSLTEIKAVLHNSQLWRLNIGILLLHAILTANFLALPLALQNFAGLPAAHQWYVYLPALLVAFMIVMPILRRSAIREDAQGLTLKMVILLGIAQLLLIVLPHSALCITFCLCLFFTAFTLLEATLPSAVSKIAPVVYKGTALGIFSSCQFFGIFLGGILGGWLYHQFHITGIFAGGLVLTILWILSVARYSRMG